MRNLIIFLSTFTLTVLLAVFMSAPANAGGAGGSWGCPEGWTTKPDGTCSFGGGGGGSGGGGAGGSWEQCTYNISSTEGETGWDACKNHHGSAAIKFEFVDNPSGSFTGYCHYQGVFNVHTSPVYSTCNTVEPPECPEGTEYDGTSCVKPPPPPPPPDFPDVPPPTPDCNVCQSLYEIKLKLNVLKNQDIKIINQSILDMSQTINNIDNSITSLNVSNTQINTNIENINTSITNLVTNIENNNITQNEIKNEITNIQNVMNDYSLQLGDIKLAMGDIDVKLDNTNKLVLGLKPDIEFIKNNLVNGSPEGKDYTAQLNQIIELLKPCLPTAEKPCPGDDEVVRKLKEIEDFMKADFVPDTDSTEVEVEDLTDIELDRNLIKFGVAQCPPDNEFSTMVNGFSFSGGFKHKPLCDFFTLLSPFIKAFGGFSAALILGGGLRRG